MTNRNSKNLWGGLCFLFCLLLYQHSGAQCNINAPNITCAGSEVDMEVGNPDPGVTYEWDFDDDGDIDATGRDVSYTYPGSVNNQTYTVRVYRNGNQCGTRNITVSEGPDASIGINPSQGSLEDDEFRVCTNEKVVTVGFFNTSTTIAINQRYEISWGDGQFDVYDNSTFTPSRLIQHTYTEQGYKNIVLRVTSINGCVSEKTFRFYYGGNPSVGLVNPGNSTGLCVGESLTFPITDTRNNPPETQYRIFLNEELIGSFDQNNVPESFSWTFDESSCGRTAPSAEYKHAFEIRMVASTPCGTSSATIAPIEVSAPPELELTIDNPRRQCVGEVYKLKNTSQTQEVVSNGTATQCLSSLAASWDIQGPGDFEVVNGNVFSSEELEVAFDVPGRYGITVTVTSAVCGSFTLMDFIEVGEEVSIEPGDISLTKDGSSVCAPSVVEISNDVEAADSFEWDISPTEGWSFANGTDEDSEEPSIRFEEGGQYIIEVSARNICRTDTWIDTIEVEGAPSVEILPIREFCNQATLDFDDSMVNFRDNGYSIDSYQWSFPGSNDNGSSDAFPSGINYNGPGTYMVTVSASNSCGTSTSSTEFMIQGPVDAVIPDTVLVCTNGSPVTLSAVPGGGEWTGPGVSADGIFDPNGFGPGGTFIYYSVGVDQCADTDTTLVEILPIPAPNIGLDRTICVREDSLALPTGGLWETLGNGEINGNQFYPQRSGPGNYQLRFEVTSADGCVASDTLGIEVLEEIQVVVSDTAYCEAPGQFLLPQGSIPGGSWTGQGITTNLFSPETAGGQGLYQAVYSINSIAYCPTTDTIVIEVIPPPIVDAGDGDSLCVSEPEILLRGLPEGGFWEGPGLDTDNPDVIIPALVGAGRFDYVYVYGEGSCQVRDTLLMTLLQNPNAYAGPDRQVCGNDSTFVLLGSSPVGGRWEGDGIVNEFTGEFDPSVIPIGTSELIYTFTFPGTNCFAKDTMVIAKRPLPSPIFQTPATYCLGDTLTIIDQSIGAFEWKWTFGNGQASERRNPSFAYDTAGTYQINLMVETDFGCADSTSRMIEVIPPPTARFEFDKFGICAPIEVVFTNQSEGVIEAYEWDFGNGETSTEADPLRVNFSSAPRDTVFEVTLTAMNECGEGVFVDSIQVLTVPAVNFGFSVDTSCSPVTTQISNLTSGGIVNVSWDLGNGVTSDDFNPPRQTYTAEDQPITYDITMVASNACGVDSLTRPLYVKPANIDAFISVPQERGCGPFTVTFENFTTIGANLTWDFGDGTTSMETTPTHSFVEPGIYRVVQFAENGCGFDSTSLLLEVVEGPEVSFLTNMPTCVGLPLRFENQSLGVQSFEWAFDSLGNSQVRNPDFLFSNPGSYTVSLTGTSAETGCSTTFMEDIVIRPAPDIALTLDSTEGCQPLEVQFDAVADNGVIVQWTFGDGNASGQRNPMHTFTGSGLFEVTAKAIDSTGCEQTTIPALVRVFPRPKLAFDPEMLTDCVLPARIDMNNTSQDADNYSWDFGNGSTSNLNTPLGEYPEAGDYDILLIGENRFGCIDSMVNMVAIPKVPIADFDFDPPRGCSPLMVQFTNLSEDGDFFLWSFGDGAFSPEFSPEHTYYDAGRYDVSLIASAGNVCQDTFTLPGAIEVLPTPFANFEVLPVNTQPFDGTVLFRNLSTDAIDYFWDFGDGVVSREENPVHKLADDGIRQIYLEVTGDGGCKDDSLLVFQPPAIKGLFIPTGFSPQSGLGDVRKFKPSGVGLREYSLQVYSSYGELMWETTLLEDGQPVESWDGTINGQLQPQDVYVWKCTAVFEDGTAWSGQEDANGRRKTIGTLVLLR